MKNFLMGKIKDILSDQEWHLITEILAEIWADIPPERAVRRLGKEERLRLADDEDHQVRRGKRALLGDYLSELGLETRGPRGEEVRFSGGDSNGYRRIKYGEIRRLQRIDEALEQMEAILMCTDVVTAGGRLELIRLVQNSRKTRLEES